MAEEHRADIPISLLWVRQQHYCKGLKGHQSHSTYKVTTDPEKCSYS